MKIAVVSETLHIGGVGLITIKYASTLAKLRHEVSLIVINPDNPDDVFIPKLPNLSTLLLKPLTLKEFVDILDAHDVVILSNTAIMPFALEATRFLKHAFSVEILHTASLCAITPSVDLSVAVSRHIYDNMKPRESDIILPNAVDTSIFKPPANPQSHKPIRLIQVAKEGKVMSPDLYEVAQELLSEGYDIEAVIVGRDGQDKKAIKFVGLKTNEEVATLLQGSHILLHMSLEESFGMTIIEAMACGVIPVASNVGGIVEIITHEKDGFIVNRADKLQLLKTLKRLCEATQNHDPCINEMRQNAINTVKSRYDITQVMSNLIEIIKGKMHLRQPKECKYPFSLTAPFLFLSMQSYDRYFKALEDILNDDDLGHEYKQWQRFYSILSANIKDQASLSILDSIYSHMLADIIKHRNQSARNFWLAMIALISMQYQRALAYIRRGCPCDDEIVAKVIFCMVILWLRGSDKFSKMADLAYFIKMAYVSGQFDEIKKLKIDITAVKAIINRTEFKEVAKLLG